MALDEVLARLIEVRAKLQEAQGLTGSVEDSLRDSESQAREALSGTGNSAALDGLEMYAQAANDAKDLLPALTEADREIARYIDFASPGHASGTQNTVVPRPTGEAIVQASRKSSRRNRMAKANRELLINPGDAKDSVAQSTYLGEQVAKHILGDHNPGASTSTSVTAAPAPTTPPKPVVGDAVSSIGVTGALIAQGIVMYFSRLKNRRENRRNDRD